MKKNGKGQLIDIDLPTRNKKEYKYDNDAFEPI
jgi:hypothetical protein